MSGEDDLDRLVTELNLTVATTRATPTDLPEASATIVWLAAVREADGSDLLLVTGAPPVVRAPGRLVRLSNTALTSDDVEYLKDVAEHHAGRLLRRQRWRPKSMYNGQEPPLWIGGRGWS